MKTSIVSERLSLAGNKAICPVKTILQLIATYLGVMLLIGLSAGCAGSAKKTAPPSSVESTPVVEAHNGVTGNIMSQWVDRTPSLSHTSAFPAAGEDCGLIYDPVQRRIVLFGGKTDENKVVSEVWSLDLAKNLWQKIEIDGESPPTSEDHVVIYDPMSYRMILHGGEDGLTTNKTWALDLKTQRWRNITDSTAPAREDHTALFDSHGKRMVVFGGRNKSRDNDDINIYEIWALDLDPTSPSFEKWRNLTVEDKHPLGRSDHVAVYDSKKNRMIVYGGWDKWEKKYFDDTWAFHFAPLDSGDTMGFWKQIKTKKSHPPKRRHAVGAYDAAQNWFIIFGGFGEEGYLNDVWAFDLDYDVWINITPGPQPRIDQQAVYDPQSQRLIIYGGDARLNSKFHDVWELQIQSNLPVDLILKEAGAKTNAESKP
ncbi:MAG: Kelch repeat-containing protein [bacterium]